MTDTENKATATVASTAADASTQAQRDQPKQLTADTQTDTANRTADQGTQSQPSRRRDRSSRARRDAKSKSTTAPKGKTTSENAPNKPQLDDKKDGGRRQQSNSRASGRGQRRRSPGNNQSNLVTIGSRLPMVQYVRIVKNILNENKHETLELMGYRDSGMAKLTQVVNVLTSWGYVAVNKIKTRPDPALKIIIRRTDDFQEKFDAFAKVLTEKREERLRLKAESDAAKDAVKDEVKDGVKDQAVDDKVDDKVDGAADEADKKKDEGEADQVDATTTDATTTDAKNETVDAEKSLE